MATCDENLLSKSIVATLLSKAACNHTNDLGREDMIESSSENKSWIDIYTPNCKFCAARSHFAFL